MIEPYLKALLKEIDLYSEKLKEYHIKSIFIGGGTPSILTGKQLTTLLESVIKTFHIGKNPEITMEMNPGTVTLEKLQQYYKAGINRLSIGLQACQNHLLKKLGRIHSYEDFQKNLQDAQKVGFNNINVDLMFALPGQRMEDWKQSLEIVTKLGIQHISSYSLIWEEETLFHQWNEEGKMKELDEELELEMYHEAIEYLKEQGYHHYEISNFAKTGYQCEHNLTYWHNQHYVGLGAGAHSYLSQKRYNNEGEIVSYINALEVGRLAVKETIQNSREDEISETMFLGLRLTNGIAIKDFKERFGISPMEIYKEQFTKLTKQNLVIINDERIQLTPKGIDLSNLVFQEMLL